MRSAGGHEEHPWLVNNSTTAVGLLATCAIDCVLAIAMTENKATVNSFEETIIIGSLLNERLNITGGAFFANQQVVSGLLCF